MTIFPRIKICQRRSRRRQGIIYEILRLDTYAMVKVWGELVRVLEEIRKMEKTKEEIKEEIEKEIKDSVDDFIGTIKKEPCCEYFSDKTEADWECEKSL